ncbi:MAG TPA: translation initiation factor IF-2 [Candidatus Paceibacterota bacterium]|nr:translation initiation factor IF-2 [Candidatus Pacearchaeota archaeon]HRZ51027.1 translation initiation factor IF-2 [Candidatus Paceibacterota bacterium]HSA36814.1 translation initiation factor IF-2 [Candidatus Paceibacterota bacterium]
METKENRTIRPPVIVVMGHVDHGKTSILDYIRKTHIAEKESGGITQHIGASQIEHNKKLITFIDTPGHEAFSQMRMRGSKIADIAILVVAAVEGLQPQSREAIKHIKKAGIPMIVAINKIDMPGANPDKVKRELQKEDVSVEDWGGNVPSVHVSARTGEGINELLEMISLVAEMEDLQASLDKPARGIVIESSLDPKRGPSASVLLQDGLLQPGMALATPTAFGKIKSLENFRASKIEKALPSQPVVITGFESVPKIGEAFEVMPNIETARQFTQSPSGKSLKEKTACAPVKEGQKVLNLILKADFLGSSEVLEETLAQLPQTETAMRVVDSGVGEINLTDVKMAKSCNAVIIGFRVKTHPTAQVMAEREKIRVMNFDVIYELVEWLQKFMDKMKEPQIVRKDIGKLKVLLSFWAEKNRQIVGGKITEGEVKKGVKIEVVRNNAVVSHGRLINLQKNKKDIVDAGKGEEVGILFEGSEKIQEGDYLVFYTQEKNF